MNHRSLKITGGALVVLVAAYAGASWYAGRLAQRNIEAWVSRTNQDIAAQWGARTPAPSLRVMSYDRGVFSSRIEYALDYRDERGAAHELGLRDSLQHGPWPWAAVRAGIWQPLAAYSHLTPAPGGDWKAWSDAMPSGVPPWVANSRIGFSGDVFTLARLAPVKAGAVDFSGGSLQVRYEPDSHETTLSMHFERLVVLAPSARETLKLGGLDLQAQNRGSGEPSRQAHQQMHLDELDIIPQDGLPVVLRGQSLVFDTAQTGSLMDGEAHYQADQLQLAARDLGKLQLDVSMQNLAVPALQSLAQTMGRIDAAHARGEGLSDQEQRQIRAGLLPVLAASPRFALRTLRWTNSEGATELKAGADFGPVGDDAPAGLGAALEQAIRALSLHLRLSKPMLMQVVRQSQAGPNTDVAVALVSMVFDQYVGRLARAGLVKQADPGMVLMDLDYANGRVTANGVPMSPSELGQRLGALPGGAF